MKSSLQHSHQAPGSFSWRLRPMEQQSFGIVSPGISLPPLSVPGSRATAATFTPDGSAVVIGAQNGGIFIWPILGRLSNPAMLLSACFVRPIVRVFPIR